ncbi:MAG: 30S ribosomal protein S8 [bacterium]|nr:30S ribosomal protein S8 [bacterium]
MAMTDPIADFLTRIRNAIQARKDEVDIPASGLKTAIAKIMKEEGFIKNYKVLKNNRQGIIRITLKRSEGDQGAIIGLKRVSKPGLRVYVGAGEIPKVRNGMGIAVLSTPKGLLTDRQSRKEHVGGEVLCKIW